MWREVRVSLDKLKDVEALEKSIKGRIMNVQVEDEEAIVEYVPVVSDSWFVEVWDNQATVYFVNEFDFILDVSEIYRVDEKARQRVIRQILEDYGITLEESGQYYPISQEAQEAYEAMMAGAERKRSSSRSYG